MRVKHYVIDEARTLWHLLLVIGIAGLLLPILAASQTRRNGKIAFTSERDGGNPEIYTMNPDGTDQTRLTNNSIVDDHPMWSPDGKKLAFVSQRAAGDFAIFQMNMDGSNRVEITRLSNYVSRAPDGVIGFSMSWSPTAGRSLIRMVPAELLQAIKTFLS